ncbi:14004_t:CDS:2, partial [Dentiscutata heterogama]
RCHHYGIGDDKDDNSNEHVLEHCNNTEIGNEKEKYKAFYSRHNPTKNENFGDTSSDEKNVYKSSNADEVDKSLADSNKLANTESGDPMGLEWYLHVDGGMNDNIDDDVDCIKIMKCTMVENEEEMSQRREIVSGTNEDINNTNRGAVVINSDKKRIDVNNRNGVIICSTSSDKACQKINVKLEDPPEPDGKVNLIKSVATGCSNVGDCYPYGIRNNKNECKVFIYQQKSEDEGNVNGIDVIAVRRFKTIENDIQTLKRGDRMMKGQTNQNKLCKGQSLEKDEQTSKEEHELEFLDNVGKFRQNLIKTKEQSKLLNPVVLRKLTIGNVDLLNFGSELLPEEKQHVKGRLINEVSKMFTFSLSELEHTDLVKYEVRTE